MQAEEEGGGYKIIYGFEEGTQENIKETLLLLFLHHVMWHTIILEEEIGPNIDYGDYKIISSQYRLEVKFYKYSWLHPMAAGHEEVGF